MFALMPLYSPASAVLDHDRILEQMRTRVVRAQVHNDLYREEVWHRFDVTEQLPGIRCPTLVICGAEDWICDPAQSRLLAAGIPDARLVEVPDSDHSIPADTLLAHTRAFLQELRDV
ncbi:MAG: putative aminoacrylate hydrolase RutD [Stenotrophomonas maltophilia]|nr:MAG: putative aminoacrylate hydrolase RutD [Stenotrophomonas maltophilia]